MKVRILESVSESKVLDFFKDKFLKNFVGKEAIVRMAEGNHLYLEFEGWSLWIEKEHLEIITESIEKLELNNFVLDLDTGEVGKVIEIRKAKCKYPVIVTFDNEIMSGKIAEEYLVKRYTIKGCSDWRNENSLKIIKIGER